MKRIVDKTLLEAVRSLPCIVCEPGTQEQPTDPHHVTSRGAGGSDTADNVMPLCRMHHRQWDAPFQGPGFMFEKYPSIRTWLEFAGRTDVIERLERINADSKNSSRRFW